MLLGRKHFRHRVRHVKGLHLVVRKQTESSSLKNSPADMMWMHLAAPYASGAYHERSAGSWTWVIQQILQITCSALPDYRSKQKHLWHTYPLKSWRGAHYKPEYWVAERAFWCAPHSYSIKYMPNFFNCFCSLLQGAQNCWYTEKEFLGLFTTVFEAACYYFWETEIFSDTKL